MTDLAPGSAVFRPAIPAPRTRPAGTLEVVWLSWRDPLRIWSERHFELPILYGESWMGRAMTVSDPANIRKVLVEDASAFHKTAIQRRLLGPLIGGGIFLAEDEEWRVMRRILAPTFTPRRIAQSAPRMLAIARARAATWQDGQVVPVDLEMTRLTFEILSATLFSDALMGEADAFERAINAYVARAARIDPLDLIGAPDWIPRLGLIFAGGAGAFFEQRVNELAVARRKAFEAGEDLPDDLLTALIKAQDPETGTGLTDRQVAANILTFILAGHETTARALAWTLYLLARSPVHQARLRQEADAFEFAEPEALEKLVWTSAAFEEAMRLFPPAPVFTRVAIRETTVANRKITPGTSMLIVPWVLHRHRKLWDDPAAFKPERFLPGAREAIDRFAYLPFGGGPRVCIGASFAMQEAVIALAAILKAVELEPVDAHEPLPAHRITLRPRTAIRLRARRRG